jgi:hypothetical protein
VNFFRGNLILDLPLDVLCVRTYKIHIVHRIVMRMSPEIESKFFCVSFFCDSPATHSRGFIDQSESEVL